MSPGQVCESHAGKEVSLTVRVEENTVFIEGSELALEFLSKLLDAQGKFEPDTGFEIAPAGPGSIFFSPDATHGIYIHRSG